MTWIQVLIENKWLLGYNIWIKIIGVFEEGSMEQSYNEIENHSFLIKESGILKRSEHVERIPRLIHISYIFL